MTLADAMVKSQKIWQRKPADFYPTPFDVTVALVDFLQIDEFDTIWEPAAGDGDMVLPLEAMGYDVFSTDIRQTRFIEQTRGGMAFNFLMNLGTKHTAKNPPWIISNPPFSLAAEFIERALSITPNVAMLVRSQYWHAKSRVKLFEDNKPSWILPLTWRPAFEERTRGKSPLMDVSWVVWQGRGRNQDPSFTPLLRPTAKRMKPIAQYCIDKKAEYGIVHEADMKPLLQTYMEGLMS